MSLFDTILGSISFINFKGIVSREEELRQFLSRQIVDH